MRNVALVVLMVLLWLSLALAQTRVPSPTPATVLIGWDHDGVQVDGFRLCVDSLPCTDLGAVARQPDGHYEVQFPALTPGTHALTVVTYNVAGETLSDPWSVEVVVVPGKATNIRIIRKTEE